MIRLLIILFVSICTSNELEKLTYEVYFNNLKAGKASLKLSEDANKENYVLNFELRSHKYLDAIYKLRENTSMIIDRKATTPIATIRPAIIFPVFILICHFLF